MYVPMKKVQLSRGYHRLGARKVLSWPQCNTKGADFCVHVLDAAIQIRGCPKIMNTDQGVQFISTAFVKVLQRHQIPIRFSI